ncbi:neoverrucotoxin subunit alpha-like isoform X2 [Notolabrus celidotus]|uniref:neoverrucotoxin subunit alpha-like isoform X2 n=1 Tax=Notolabrus celidotus TaxID=1203425 RepID=UPI0014907B67|nr:neoverrucotoxin subunit alpha-like isoform X2 [Notolabrus celidotus]
MASELMNVAALGRPFTLGMLYDARKDALIPGLTLWNDKTLQEKTVESSQRSSSFQISTSDSIESKSSLLDIDASLKASFMSGLVNVEGSAKFMKSTKHSKKDSRVTFQYNATTHFRQLYMADMMTLDTQQTDLLKKGTATHVVTGILYGAHAFFVFDSENSDNESSQDISGHMRAVINKIPSFNVEGEVNIKLTDEEKALTDKFSCKFYGDLLLKSNPASFTEAVKTYVELPTLLGEKGEYCVPLKVWLMPLKDLDPSAVELSSGISLELVMEVNDALEDLRGIGMRCNDALADSVVERLPQIQKKLHRFQELCKYYETHLKKTMAKKLPLIRGGTEEEGPVMQIFEKRAKSPFSSEQLNKWMDDTEREINVVWSCLAILKGARILPNRSELDRVILDPQSKLGVCFAFTSLDLPDPRLDAMSSFLDSVKTVTTNEVPWYYSEKTVELMRKLAEAATFFKSDLRLVSVIANEALTGACVYYYKDGKLGHPVILPELMETHKEDLTLHNQHRPLDFERFIQPEGNRK